MTPERWRQVDELFTEAAELPQEERKAFLTSACKDDVALLQEVELLLEHDARTTAPALHSALKSGLAVWANKGRDLVGRHVGPYRILEPLGRGGMGAVFLAVRDDDQFQKQVAIKLVRSDMDTEVILQRFRQERQILANLQHPNIAQLLDGGVTNDGLPYFAMEYVEGGRPISEYVTALKLPVVERLKLFRQVCAAVQYAHQNLVVHRDLKPGNILVGPGGMVKLLDFGVAKVLEAESGASVTSTGMMMLTPEYASPEQVRGDAVTTTSDVYMLGAVLYELLTGEQAHRLKDYSPLQIAEAICDAETERPSSAVTRTDPLLKSQLEGDLDNIVLTAMRKERERRYPSVEALSEDIRRYLEGLPISAREDTVAYRAGKFIRRNRIWLAAASLVVVSAVIGTGVALVQAQRAERRFQQVRKLANTFLFSFHDKIQNLQGATEAREFVVQTALGYLDSLARESGNDAALLEELANAYLRVGQVQGDPRGPNLGHSDAAMASLAKAVQIAEGLRLGNPDHAGALRVLIPAYTQEGDIKTQRGNAAEGAAAQVKAVDAAERLCARKDVTPADNTLLLQALLRLGDSLLEDAPKDALNRYKQALEVARRLPEGDAKTKSAMQQTYQRLGRVSHALGDAVEGIRYYREAESIIRKLRKEDPQNARYPRELMTVLTFLGNYSGHPGYFHLGDTQAALRYYNEAGDLSRQQTKGDAKDVRARLDQATNVAKVGEVQITANPSEGIRAAEQCITALQPLREAQPENFLYQRIFQNCASVLGRSLSAAGKHGEALKSLQQTLAAANAMQERSPKDLGARATVISTHADLGSAYINMRNYAMAERELRLTLDMLEEVIRELPADLFFLKDLALTQEEMGRMSQGMGKRAEAKEWYQRALATWERWRKLTKDGPYIDLQLARVRKAGGLP